MTTVTVVHIEGNTVTLSDDRGNVYKVSSNEFPDIPRPRDEYDAVVVNGKIAKLV